MKPTIVLLLLYQLLFSTGCQAIKVLRKFSTKTTYENSFLQDNQYYLETNLDEEWAVHHCEPVAVTGLFRHGIRFPGEKDIANIAKAIFKMKVAGVSSLQIDLLEAVANKFLIADAKDLAEEGKKELWNLGRRFGKRMTKMLSEATPSDFEFVMSSKSRAMSSCESFKLGFFDHIGKPLHLNSSVDDYLLRFFDECSKYVVRVAENSSATAEWSRFLQAILPQMNARIAERLDIKHLDLSDDEIKSVHVIAGTELAIFGSSTWSDLLSDDDLELLEYAADIKNFWKKGYGFSINYEPSCVLLKHMFQHFDNFVNGKIGKKAVFYFGHTETVIPFLSILGLFRDTEPLMSSNYDHHSNRQFRTTRISPFASNVAFVLQRCPDKHGGDTPFSAERYSIRLLFKERPLAFPACDELDCPYLTVRNLYAQHIDACNFSEMCHSRFHEDL